MLTGLLYGLVSLFAGALVGGLAVYFGVPLGSERVTITGERAFVIGTVGAVVYVVVSGLLGWIPIVGALLGAAAWIGVVSHFTTVDPLTAVGVGLVAWAMTVIVAAGVTEVIFGIGG